MIRSIVVLCVAMLALAGCKEDAGSVGATRAMLDEQEAIVSPEPSGLYSNPGRWVRIAGMAGYEKVSYSFSNGSLSVTLISASDSEMSDAKVNKSYADYIKKGSVYYLSNKSGFPLSLYSHLIIQPWEHGLIVRKEAGEPMFLVARSDNYAFPNQDVNMTGNASVSDVKSKLWGYLGLVFLASLPLFVLGVIRRSQNNV